MASSALAMNVVSRGAVPAPAPAAPRGWLRRRRAPAAPDVCLTTWLTSRTLAHWRVSAEGAVALARGELARVIAFHPDERRVASAARSIESAKSFVVREGHALERVRVVNRSRESGWIYAAPVGYLESLLRQDVEASPGVRRFGQASVPDGPCIASVAPGLLLVDRLLARAQAASESAAASWPEQERSRAFPSPSVPGTGAPARGLAVLIDLCTPREQRAAQRLARERLVIAVVLGEAFDSPAVVCSVTDEPVHDVARLVMYEHKLPEHSPWTLFHCADVLAAAGEVEPYPAHGEWNGVPLRRLLHAALLGSAALAAGGAGYAWDVARRIGSAEAQAAEARSAIDATQREVGALLRARPGALAREIGLDAAATLDRASVLWRPGARVSIDSRAGATDYTVSVPFARARLTFDNRPSVHAATEASRLAAVLAIEPPAGCVRASLNTTGALNEVSLVIRCENPDSALARVLPR